MRTHLSSLAAAAALLLATWLTACGGSSGFPPVITAVKPQSLSYARATVAMAHTNVFNTATSQFDVNLVDAIAAAPTGVFNGATGVPLTDITNLMALQSQCFKRAHTYRQSAIVLCI